MVVGAHLDEHVLALHGLRSVELDDLDDVDQLVQLLGHLLERQLVDVDDDRDARETRHLGHADGEGLDVEAAAGEQPGDAGQQTRLVLDEEAQHVTCDMAQSSSSNAGAWSRAYWT